MPGPKSTANIFLALHAENGEAPEWINVLPAGVIKTQDGRGPYTVSDMAALATESLQAAGGKLPVDENHATDYAAPSGHPSPARGWIVVLQVRDAALWGRVEWSAAGKALFADKAYRGISPVFEHDKSGRVLRVLRASLTNTPNLRGLAALHSEESSQGANMDLLAELRKLLGLPEDADAAAVIAKVTELNAGAAAAKTAQSQLKEIAKAAKVAEGADATVVLHAVTSLATAATTGADARVTALQSELATVTTSLNSLQAAHAKDRATAFVDDAIKAGRVGVKPLRDHYIAEHAKDPTRVEKEITAMPILEPSTLRASAHAAAASDLDPTAIAAQATAYQKQQAAAGVTIDYASAVTHVTTKKKEQAQ